MLDIKKIEIFLKKLYYSNIKIIPFVAKYYVEELLMQGIQTIRINCIQRFCVNDGPGIRTTIFMQGCPLRCWWCHNSYMQEKNGGTLKRINELIPELTRDARFWQYSNGGVTLSGGEPLFQAKAATFFSNSIKKIGFHVCIETSGYAELKKVQMMNDAISLWLFDLKTVNPITFSRACSGKISIVLENLSWLLHHNPNSIWIRIPLINGFNADDRSIIEIGRFLTKQPQPKRIQLLPGHKIGLKTKLNPVTKSKDYQRARNILNEFVEHVEICL